VQHELNVGGHSGYFVLVHIKTDEGVEGWGECATGSDFGEAAFAAKAIIEKGFARRLIGKDPREYRKLWEVLYASTENYGRRDLGVLALSGVDTALVDIAAKKYGVPACVLLGGRYIEEVPLYASLLFDMDDPVGTASKGKKYVNENYVGIKFGWGMVPSKPFGRDLKTDEAMVKTIRETLGYDVKLMVDVGRYANLSSSQVLKMARAFEKYDITWLEEPLPRDDIDGYRVISRRSPIPIAAGEGYRGMHDFRRSITRGEVNLLQPDVSKAGGLSETKRIVEMAHDFNVPWVPHNWSTAVNSAATLHLVASSTDGYLMEFKQEPNPLIQKIVKHGEEIFSDQGGKMRVPSGPGLGIEIDEDAVAKYEVS
jgi:L-alanine-DL-glutamate epimerase-like enolase superfamily enzyme